MQLKIRFYHILLLVAVGFVIFAGYMVMMILDINPLQNYRVKHELLKENPGITKITKEYINHGWGEAKQYVFFVIKDGKNQQIWVDEQGNIIDDMPLE